MQISSQNDTQSILSIARQSALGKNSKDQNNETNGDFQSSLSSAGVSYSQGYLSFQNSLAATASLGETTAITGIPTTTADGKYSVPPRDSTGQVNSLLVDLNGSDIDLIAKATGSTYVDGDFIGGDQEGAQDLTSALWAMRKSGTGAGSTATPVKGDITASNILSYITNRGQTIENFKAIDKAIELLQ